MHHPTAEPQQGDSVYVTGHGPAIIVDVTPSENGKAEPQRGLKKFKVIYPDGTTDLVAQEQILVSENPPAGAASPTGSPRLASRRVSNLSPRSRSSRCTDFASAAAPLYCSGPRRLEYLGRAFDDEGRNMRTQSATFSLVATMVGGGVLSLPYAMSQCGIALGIIALLGSAVASAWTLDMLVDCARCTGRDTFELIGHAAYGEFGRKVTIALVFIICWLALVAYSVLIGDLLVPIANLAIPGLPEVLGSNEALRRSTICAAMVVLSPMCFKSNLNALSFLCFASVGSVVVVGIVIAFRAAQHLGEPHEVLVMLPSQDIMPITVSGAIRWWPAEWAQALYVVPMFGVSFMCHFNALPTHQELQRPTRPRMRRVLFLCMSFTCLLYLFVGLSGYLYAGMCTCGNILLNFDQKDKLAVLTRAILAIVLMLNFPLICQPCRNALFRVLSGSQCCQSGTTNGDGQSASDPVGGSVAGGSATGSELASGLCLQELTTASGSSSSLALPEKKDCTSSEAKPAGEMEFVMDPATPSPAELQADQLQASDSSGSRSQGPPPPPGPSSPQAAKVHVYLRETMQGRVPAGSSVEALDAYFPKDETVQQSAADPSDCQRYCLTAGVLGSALLLACMLKSVLVVWSILGSSVCFMVGFILPASFWRRIMGPFVDANSRIAAGVLLAIVWAMAVVCTIQACFKLDAPPCPLVHGNGLTQGDTYPQAQLSVAEMVTSLTA